MSITRGRGEGGRKKEVLLKAKVHRETNETARLSEWAPASCNAMTLLKKRKKKGPCFPSSTVLVLHRLDWSIQHIWSQSLVSLSVFVTPPGSVSLCGHAFTEETVRYFMLINIEPVLMSITSTDLMGQEYQSKLPHVTDLKECSSLLRFGGRKKMYVLLFNVSNASFFLNWYLPDNFTKKIPITMTV